MASNSVVDTMEIAVDSVQHSGASDSGWILHHVMDEKVLSFDLIFEYHNPHPAIPNIIWNRFSPG